MMDIWHNHHAENTFTHYRFISNFKDLVKISRIQSCAWTHCTLIEWHNGVSTPQSRFFHLCWDSKFRYGGSSSEYLEKNHQSWTREMTNFHSWFEPRQWVTLWSVSRRPSLLKATLYLHSSETYIKLDITTPHIYMENIMFVNGLYFDILIDFNFLFNLDTGHGTLFTSGKQGIIYSESLQKHLYPNYGDVTDFYHVDSLTGVYIASQMRDDNSIQSVITYNRGGNWQPIPRPVGAPCKDETKVHYVNDFIFFCTLISVN